jgi:hypothetical protein
LINTASLSAWLAIPGRTAAELVVRAAEEADDRTERVSQATLTHVVEHDRAFILVPGLLRSPAQEVSGAARADGHLLVAG